MLAASVNLLPEAPVSQMVALGRSAEALGYARCWIYDEGLATRDVYITLCRHRPGHVAHQARHRHHQPLHAAPGHHRCHHRHARRAQ